jgi:hypothetical protein
MVKEMREERKNSTVIPIYKKSEIKRQRPIEKIAYLMHVMKYKVKV